MHFLDVKLLCPENLVFMHNAQFDHIEATLLFRSSVQRSLNNTETMQFAAAFAFLMCIPTKVECSMTQTNGNTTVHEAQQCTFWTLVMETVTCGYCVTLLTVGSRRTPSWFQVNVQRDANKTDTVLSTLFFAFVLYGNKVECKMTWPVAHEGNRCTFWTSCTDVTETSFLEHNEQLWLDLAYIYPNLVETSPAHRYGKYTENAIFRLFRGLSATGIW